MNCKDKLLQGEGYVSFIDLNCFIFSIGLLQRYLLLLRYPLPWHWTVTCNEHKNQRNKCFPPNILTHLFDFINLYTPSALVLLIQKNKVFVIYQNQRQFI